MKGGSFNNRLITHDHDIEVLNNSTPNFLQILDQKKFDSIKKRRFTYFESSRFRSVSFVLISRRNACINRKNMSLKTSTSIFRVLDR